MKTKCQALYVNFYRKGACNSCLIGRGVFKLWTSPLKILESVNWVMCTFGKKKIAKCKTKDIIFITFILKVSFFFKKKKKKAKDAYIS